jgi:hypothetical protein
LPMPTIFASSSFNSEVKLPSLAAMCYSLIKHSRDCMHYIWSFFMFCVFWTLKTSLDLRFLGYLIADVAVACEYLLWNLQWSFSTGIFLHVFCHVLISTLLSKSESCDKSYYCTLLY